MQDSEELSDEEQTIAKDIVVTKYKMAADIANSVIQKLVDKCVDGASVLELCVFGDNLLTEETGKVFRKEKDMKKGIAMPVCINVNNCACHYSALRSDPDIVLRSGNLAKIELGCHVDGFVAMVAHSLVIGADKDNIVTGRAADVMLAAHFASEVALRLVVPETENFKVTDAVQAVCESYGCKPLEGLLSYELKQHNITGEKKFMLNPSEQQRIDLEKQKFGIHEVYAVDILVSTGDGKARETDVRCRVYKREDKIYQLKMKASRSFFSELEKKAGLMPFSLRNLETVKEGEARMGVKECLQHDLLQSYPVLYERDSELVAHFKFTVLLMPNGPMRITGLPFNTDLYHSDKAIKDEHIKNLLRQSVSKKSAKKKKKKVKNTVAMEAAAMDTGAGDADDDED